MGDEAADDGPELSTATDPEIRQRLGVFDTPAYARRGQELEHRMASVRAHCRRQRLILLEPVQMRLRQWARLATGPDDGLDCLTQSLGKLCIDCESPTLRWAPVATSTWRRRGVARDLVASLDRFNRRWAQFLPIIDLKPLNVAIEQYNRYYVFEKECAMGSARLAAQHFQPIHAWSLEQLWSEFPLIEPLALRK